MKRISMTRIVIVAAVTLISIALVFPTARYFMALAQDAPADAAEKTKWEDHLEELRKSAITLGLDLRGGVDVTLTIDRAKFASSFVSSQVATLTNEFDNKKISAKAEALADGKSFVVKALDPADARPVANILTDHAYRITGDISEEALRNPNGVTLSANQEALDADWRGVIQAVEQRVRERLDKSGLTQPSISRQGTSHIRVQIPGEKNPDRVIDNLTRLAKMEFRLAHEAYLTPEDPIHRLLDAEGKNLKPDAVIPKGYEVVPFRFGKFDRKQQKMTYDEGKMLVSTRVELTGETLRSAGVTQNTMDIENPIQVTLAFKKEGADAFERVSRASAEKFRKGQAPDKLAIILDGVVVSAPKMENPIPGGNAVIYGGFTFEEATDISLALKAGSLPAPLVVESKQQVGATIGTESIFDGVKALFVGTALIVAFMVFYYGTAGMISILALVLNILMVAAIMQLSNATLTLSGIGGVLLTVGMAVDTNVLIYERMREEIDAGRPLAQAIRLGFDRALSVILDSHITTLLTALILLQFTSGSVYGFALTMVFGLTANLFTGLTVTYTLCGLWFQWRGSLGLGKLRFMKNAAFDFVKFSKLSIGISVAVFTAGVLLVALTGGLRFGVDFEGGVIADVKFAAQTSEKELAALLEEAKLEGARVQSVPGVSRYILRVKGIDAADSTSVTEARLRETIAAKYPGEGAYEVLGVTSFGPETGDQFTKMAITVVLLASIAILAYLWFRFELVFGAAAVAALVHDLVITTVLCTLWRTEITLDTVAALMILLGFSVNDTIVVFDRIRENARKHPGMGFGELCNLSMNETLGRTLITSGTVFLVTFVMLVMGGKGLTSFAKIMFIGSIIGSYSSVFFAAPLVYHYNRWRGGRIAKTLREKKDVGPEKAKDPGAADKDPRDERPASFGGNVPKRRGV